MILIIWQCDISSTTSVESETSIVALTHKIGMAYCGCVNFIPHREDGNPPLVQHDRENGNEGTGSEAGEAQLA